MKTNNIPSRARDKFNIIHSGTLIRMRSIVPHARMRPFYAPPRNSYMVGWCWQHLPRPGGGNAERNNGG